MKPYQIIAAALFSVSLTSCDAQNKTAKDTTDTVSPSQTDNAAIWSFFIETQAARGLLDYSKQQDVRFTATMNAIDREFNPASNPSTEDLKYWKTVLQPMWKKYSDRMAGIAAAFENKVSPSVINGLKERSAAQNEAHDASILFLDSVLAFREALKQPILGGDKLARTEVAMKANNVKLTALRAAEVNADKEFAGIAIPLLNLDQAKGKELVTGIEKRTEELKKEEARK